MYASDPDARVEGARLVWELAHMDRCETRHIRIFLRCEREGELVACFCVSATPVAFCSILCAKPILTCHKCGPEEACPGDILNYTISVGNKGSCAARDVVVTDIIPSGLEHISGQSTLSFKLGDIAPCQTKSINLCLSAAQRGTHCNRAVVSACNADDVSCESYVDVCRYCCEVTKEGPKEVRIGQNAEYKITVVNQGSEPDRNVRLTVRFPAEINPVSAMGASPGQVAGQVVTFSPLAMSNPRQTVEYRIDGRAKSQGDARVKVELMADSIATPIVEEESTIVN